MKRRLLLIGVIFCSLIFLPTFCRCADNSIPTVREQLVQWGLLESIYINEATARTTTMGIGFSPEFSLTSHRVKSITLSLLTTARTSFKINFQVPDDADLLEVKEGFNLYSCCLARLEFDADWLESRQVIHLFQQSEWLKKNLRKVVITAPLHQKSGVLTMIREAFPEKLLKP